MRTDETIKQIYQLMFQQFGPQHWWPGDSPFEVCVGAILTQNTAWSNVEKAIANLKDHGLLNFESLLKASPAHIAECIKPAGYYNLKAKRLKSFLEHVNKKYGSFDELERCSKKRKIGTDGVAFLREVFLSINGIGPETADSMTLYAFSQPTFVVDAYTKRILARHSLLGEEADYYQIKDFFESHLQADPQLFNEYHALIVMVGKKFCKKSRALCDQCPLKGLL